MWSRTHTHIYIYISYIYIYIISYHIIYIYIYLIYNWNHIAWILWILVVWGHQTPLQYGTGPTASERRSSSESTGRASLSQVSLCMSSAELGRWKPLDVWLGRSWKWHRPRTTRVSRSSRSSRFVSQSLADLSRLQGSVLRIKSTRLTDFSDLLPEAMQMVALYSQCMKRMTSSHRRTESIGTYDTILQAGIGTYWGSQTCPFAMSFCDSVQELRLEQRRIRDQLDSGGVLGAVNHWWSIVNRWTTGHGPTMWHGPRWCQRGRSTLAPESWSSWRRTDTVTYVLWNCWHLRSMLPGSAGNNSNHGRYSQEILLMGPSVHFPQYILRYTKYKYILYLVCWPHGCGLGSRQSMATRAIQYIAFPRRSALICRAKALAATNWCGKLGCISVSNTCVIFTT